MMTHVCCTAFWKLSWCPVHLKRSPNCWLKHKTMMNYFPTMLTKQQRTMKNKMCPNSHPMMMVMIAMLRTLLMLMLMHYLLLLTMHCLLLLLMHVLPPDLIVIKLLMTMLPL